MNVWLKERSLDDGDEFYNVLMTLATYKDVYARPVPNDLTKEEYPSFLEARVNLKKGVNIPSYAVITDTYWVMLDDKPIGYATIRHEVDYKKPGSHFGLCLLKEYQNKGIGSMVSELLASYDYENCGIKEVIYTAKDSNIQSQRSIEHIGAVLVDVHDGYHYYKVNLEEKYHGKGR